MSEFVSPEKKVTFAQKLLIPKNDKIDRMSFQEVKRKVKEDLIKTNIIKKNDKVKFSENKEDFVYQFNLLIINMN